MRPTRDTDIARESFMPRSSQNEIIPAELARPVFANVSLPRVAKVLRIELPSAGRAARFNRISLLSKLLGVPPTSLNNTQPFSQLLLLQFGIAAVEFVVAHNTTLDSRVTASVRA